MTLCYAVSDVRDGDYGEQIPWLVCDLPAGHPGAHTEVDTRDLDEREDEGCIATHALADWMGDV